MTDVRLVLAELRAADLLVALQSAVNGDPNWRQDARMLLHDIEHLILPANVAHRLVEIDARKRAAEIMEDAIHG